MAIIDWMLDGRGNAVVDAVAGSGKTSTLKMIAKYINSRALFLAFNKHIAEELTVELMGSNMDVATIHSVGFRALKSKVGRGVQVNSRKYNQLCSLVMPGAKKGRLDRERAQLSSDAKKVYQSLSHEAQDTIYDEYPITQLSKLVNMCRIELLRYQSELQLDWFTQLSPICSHYDIDIPEGIEPWLCSVVPMIMRTGERLLKKECDFTDMIWAPHQINAKPQQYSFVLVDESQDLSRAQLETAMACQWTGGRMLFVGDRNQAIYGFAGAQTDSIDLIIDETDSIELPLHVCYRCPSSHIELAKEIVPHIEAADWADEGTIETVKHEQLAELLIDGDIIECRTTAPLIKLCFSLLASGVSARVRGKDIGRQIITTLDEVVDQSGFRFNRFPEYLNKWANEKTQKILRQNDNDHEDSRIESINDRKDCLVAFYEMSGATSVSAMKQTIEDIFDDKRPAVWLSTVHRVKGLEADRVFILHPELMPLPFAKKEWQIQQEHNLKYVALTRAKKALFFIE
jgi:superfamily I DNA/RNA helicase